MIRAVLIGAALTACAGAPPPAVTPTHEAWAQTQWPDHAAGQLEQGRALFIDRCAGCHRPPAPDDEAPADWPATVADMATRGGIATAEARLIERYLVSVTSSAR